MWILASQVNDSRFDMGIPVAEKVKRATISPGGVIAVELRKEDENATKGDVARLEQKLDALLGR